MRHLTVAQQNRSRTQVLNGTDIVRNKEKGRSRFQDGVDAFETLLLKEYIAEVTSKPVAQSTAAV